MRDGLLPLVPISHLYDASLVEADERLKQILKSLYQLMHEMECWCNNIVFIKNTFNA